MFANFCSVYTLLREEFSLNTINTADSSFRLNAETVVFVMCLLPMNYSLAL